MQTLLYCLTWNLLLVTGAALILWSLSATRALRDRPALRHFFLVVGATEIHYATTDSRTITACGRE